MSSAISAIAPRQATVNIHIPKTGGTSLANALARCFRNEDVFLGDMTVERLTELAPRLSERILISGHPMRGVFHAVPGHVLTCTVLRDPKHQAVSEFLHICRDDTPASAAAREMGFTKFAAAYPYLLAFQAGSLLVASTDLEPVTAADILNRHDDALALLDGFDFVGCIERPDDLALCLPAVLGLPQPLLLNRDNAAAGYGVSRETVALLHEEYDQLRAQPELAELIAIERRLYAKTLTLVRRREHLLQHLARAFSLGRSVPQSTMTRRYAAVDPALLTVVGEKADGLIRLRGAPGLGLFGPYVDLPLGPCTARIMLAGEHRGSVTMELAAELGELVLAAEAIDLGGLAGSVVELSTVLSRPYWACEVRLVCGDAVSADIAAVEIEYTKGSS